MLNIEETLLNTYLDSDYIFEEDNVFDADEHLFWILRFIGFLSDYGVPETERTYPNSVNMIFYNLMRYCRAKEIDFIDCIQHAYDQIKDRKGKMIDGVFVMYINSKLCSKFGSVDSRDNDTLQKSIKEIDSIMIELRRMLA